MSSYKNLSQADGAETPHCSCAGVVATIGFFDGVHRGHRYLINKVMERAHAHAQQSLIITFDRHPREVLQSDYQPQMLTTLNTKLRLLHETGIDRVEVLHFTRQLAALSARQFMAQVLKERLGVTTLVIGYDHRFGHDRAEGFDDYVRYGKELGIEVVVYSLEGRRITDTDNLKPGLYIVNGKKMLIGKKR